jgi:hypothetical protein
MVYPHLMCWGKEAVDSFIVISGAKLVLQAIKTYVTSK